MVKKIVKEISVFLFSFIIFITIFYYGIRPSLINYVVIEQPFDYQYAAIWDFSDLDDYSYDDSLVEINSNGAKLKLVTTIYEWQEENITGYNIERAFHNSHDRTYRVEAIDYKKIEVDENDIFDVSFESQMDNGYIISMYLKNSDPSDIYLCDLSEQCSSPGHGIVSFDGDEAWLNITVTGLTSGIEGFNIKADDVKFDYINATKIEYITHTEENLTYPLSAEIETDDYVIENLKSFDSFSYEHELNGNSVEYYYSVDSGENWDLIEDNLSSVDTTNNKIRFKAVFYSDVESTPILEEMRLGYTILCPEDWNAQCGECLANDTKLKYYIDANICGTTANIPEDNGSYVECDYCTPSWSCSEYGDCQTDDSRECISVSDINNCYTQTALESDLYDGEYSEFDAEACDYCTPGWYEVNTSCQINNIIIGYYIDNNNCYNVTSLESDNNPPSNNTYECDYCLPSWSCVSYGECRQNNTKICANLADNNSCYDITGILSDLDYFSYENYTIGCVYNSTTALITRTIINKTDSKTIIEINSVGAINDTISIVEYSTSPVNIISEKKSAGKYVEIVDENISTNLSSVIIKIYYNETEINDLNIDESSLKLYYFNESSLEWQELESLVDTDENYVYVNISHLSLFGIYGDEIQSTTPEEDTSDESEEAPSTGKKESSTEKKIISETTQDFEETEEEGKEVTLEEEIIEDGPLPVLEKTKSFTQAKKIDEEVIGLVIIAVFAIIMIFILTKRKKINNI